MILFSKKVCFSLVLTIAMQTATVHAHNEIMHYFNSAVDFIKSCDTRIFIVCSYLLYIGFWSIKSGKDQKTPNQQGCKPQLQILAHGADSEIASEVMQCVNSSPMLICNFNNTLKNIQAILEHVETVDMFNQFTDVEQKNFRRLIKAEEDAIEAQYMAKNLSVLSSLPVGLDVERIKSLIEDGLPLRAITPARNLYECTRVHNTIMKQGSLCVGETQIDHLLEYWPREKLFVKINYSGHVLYRERAKLYAHLTHYYKDAVNGIVQMLENTDMRRERCLSQEVFYDFV